jgi:predicted transglutaminase-like cysteine proteinase
MTSPKEGIARISALPVGVTMLVHVAACAAWFFAWPVCAGFDGDTLSHLGIAVAVAQEITQETVQEHATAVPAQKGETEAVLRQHAHGFAMRTEGTEPPANQPASPEPALAAEAPFGRTAERVSEGEILRKWTRVQSEIRKNNEVLARCREDASSCPLAARRFLAIVDEGRARSGRARIGVINRGINLAIIPTSDVVQWGVVDRWSPPLETFTTHRGDCEDYAIAKYVALRAAGVASKDVKLVVVRNTDASENHAVVAVLLDGAWVILDNRWLTLVPDREVRRATPLFVIGEDGVRQFVTPTANARLRDGAPASF